MPSITSRGWSGSACSAQSLVRRSQTRTIAAVVHRVRPPRRRAASIEGSAARARLRVLDAEVDVRQRLDPGFLDRLAAHLADPVGAVVHPLERPIDLLDQVADVLLDREFLLPLERRRAGV